MSAVHHSNLRASLESLELDTGARPGETAPPSFTAQAAGAASGDNDTRSLRRLDLCNQIFEVVTAHHAAPTWAKPAYRVHTYDDQPDDRPPRDVLWFFACGDGVTLQNSYWCGRGRKDTGVALRKDASSGCFQIFSSGKKVTGRDADKALDKLVAAIGQQRFKRPCDERSSFHGTVEPPLAAPTTRRAVLYQQLSELVDAHNAAPGSAKPTYLYDTFDPSRHTADDQSQVLRFLKRGDGVVLQRAGDCVAGRNDTGIALYKQTSGGATRFHVIRDGQWVHSRERDAVLDELAFAIGGHSFGKPLAEPL